MTNEEDKSLEISVQNRKNTVAWSRPQRRAGYTHEPFFTICPARFLSNRHLPRPLTSTPDSSAQETTMAPKCPSRQGPPHRPGSQGPSLLLSATALSLLRNLACALLSLDCPFPSCLCTRSYLSLNTWPPPTTPPPRPRALGSAPSRSSSHCSVLPLTLGYTPSGTYHFLSDHTVWWDFARTVVKVKAKPPLTPWALPTQG